MTNEHQTQSEQMTDNEQFIGYCGIYCKNGKKVNE